MASSFSLSRSLIAWFNASNSSALLCMPAPCLPAADRSKQVVIVICRFNRKSAICKLVILFVFQYNYIIKAIHAMDSIEFSHKSQVTRIRTPQTTPLS